MSFFYKFNEKYERIPINNFEMGCCLTSSTENEVLLDNNSRESICNFRPVHITDDSDQKPEPTPSFGSAHKTFVFERIIKN